jgi:uncharacterized Zn finger protein
LTLQKSRQKRYTFRLSICVAGGISIMSIGKISEQDIRAWTGDTYFKRGLSYFNGGAIFQAQRQGTTLKARCEGSGDEAYWVSAVVEKSSIRGSDCSCPVGPSCKHVAALLLTWLRKPQEFEETEPPEDILRRLSQEELIQLTLKMLKLQPSLETLLIAKSAQRGSKAVNAETIHRQIHAVFRQNGYDYGASSSIADNLQTWLENAREYQAAEDWPAVMTICSLLAQEISENIGAMEDGDEGGDLSVLGDESVAVLGECLDPLQQDPEQRQALLRALFDLYYHDLGEGGMLEQPYLILTRQTTEDDAELLGQWLRVALNKLSVDDDWKRQSCARLLLELQGERMDEAERIQICRQYGLVEEAIRRMLSAGKIEAAVEDWRRMDERWFVHAAAWFVEAGHAELAEHEMRRQLDLWTKDREKQRQLPRLWDWLLKSAEQREDAAEAVLWSEKRFRDSPSLERYQKLQQWSRRAGTWDTLRPQLLDALRGQPSESDTLVEIHLAEQEVAEALRLIENKEHSFHRLAVAKAAEADYPEQAMGLYLKQAEAEIRHRQRQHYAAAAGHLAQIRRLCQKLGKEAEWQRLIRDLREKYRALRALREELDRAGLK